MKLLDSFVQDCGTDLGVGAYWPAPESPETKSANRAFDALICAAFPDGKGAAAQNAPTREELSDAYFTGAAAYLRDGARWGISLGARLMVELLLSSPPDPS